MKTCKLHGTFKGNGCKYCYYDNTHPMLSGWLFGEAKTFEERLKILEDNEANSFVDRAEREKRFIEKLKRYATGEFGLANEINKEYDELNGKKHDPINHPTYYNSIEILDRKEIREIIRKLEYENEMRKDMMGRLDQACNDAHLDLEKRMIELEAMKHDFYTLIKPNAQNEVKIEKLNETITKLVDKMEEIENYYYKEKKTPHKCPVCNGATVTNCLTNPYIKYKEGNVKCNACEGKGIVWG